MAPYTAHARREGPHCHVINPKTSNRARMVTLDAGAGKDRPPRKRA